MKQFTLFITFILLFWGFNVSSAQKIGVIDTDYLLKSLPEYQEADARFNQQIKSWQTELEKLQIEYEKKKELLENERILLVGDQLKSREKEVDSLHEKMQKHLKNLEFEAAGQVHSYIKSIKFGQLSKVLPKKIV